MMRIFFIRLDFVKYVIGWMGFTDDRSVLFADALVALLHFSFLHRLCSAASPFLLISPLWTAGYFRPYL